MMSVPVELIGNRNFLRVAAGICCRLTFLLLIVLPAPLRAAQSSLTPAPVRIGVLAKRGPDRTLEKWTATADYLGQSIPSHRFVIVPLGFKEIYRAVDDRDIDFVLTNSAMYIELEAGHGVNRIATMENLQDGKSYTVFGGVIFSRADRRDIRTLEDLRDKAFMGVDEDSFGGWLMAAREMKRYGINPQTELKKVRFGATHDAVVFAVLKGEVDAGTVRTDTLERMAEEGKINLADFRVIDSHLSSLPSLPGRDDFPFLRSTRLYPEWPFAKVAGVDDALAKQVAVALFNMGRESNAARAASIAGWTIPLDYQPVHDCFKELGLGPYAVKNKITFADVVEKYYRFFVLFLLVLLVLAAITLYVLKLNRDLFLSRKMIAEARDTLEQRVRERTSELEKLNEDLRLEMTIRQQAEGELRQAHAELNQIFNTAASGMTVIDKDFNLLRVNETFTNLLGISEQKALGRKCYEVFPSFRCDTVGCPMNQILGGAERYEEEDFKKTKAGKEISCIVNATPYRNSKGEVAGIIESFQDISARKRNEVALAEYAQELSRSNAELQQFAYVASHDLQEPLRMVASYVQLLARRYKGKLDSDADEFIDYAVDGANRMKQLIQDLLEYSRVNTRGKEFQPTKCEDVVKRVLANLQLAVEDTGAEISHDPLPVIMADGSQMGQLFQNLIGNAIKFRRPDGRPEIRIGVERGEKEWLFSVRDNGIGVDPQYKDKIFEIFQRLHSKETYQGTGIGLAVSKKIVERHGGRIWIESEPGKGSVFFFTIPLREVAVNE